jgi:3-oxoacyl-[acyl-carrier protein] reductase
MSGGPEIRDIPTNELHGRVALVTGSTTGLGFAVARALGHAGARVVLNYKNNEERANRALEALQSVDIEAICVKASVIDEDEVDHLCTEAENALGPIDIVTFNATPDQPLKPIEEYDWAFYQSMLDFFVKSPYLLTRRVLPHMKKQEWGRIINIGSEVFRKGVNPFSAYVAAKGAQTGWTRSMAGELAPFGVTVNIVCPGWIPVERHDDDPQDLKDGYRAMIPVDRWGVPEDVGGICAFLASDAASFITGQDVAVNGGMTVG